MNLEEIWKWLKGKRNTFFAEAATAFVLIAVLGVAGITAGRSGIAKSSEVESVRAKAEANKVEEQEQENAEKKQCFVPHRGHHRDGQNVAQHVVDEDIQPDGKEQNRRHAAGEEPPERAAIAAAGENGAIDFVEHGTFDPACPFLG